MQQNKPQSTRRTFLKGLIATSVSIILPKSLISYASSKQVEIEIKDLFYKLQQIPQLNSKIEPYYTSEDVKTIIIVQDLHMGNTLIPDNVLIEYKIKGVSNIENDERWSIEFKQLEILRKMFNINFVGLEGWCGYDIDEKRGKQILNGEQLLIKELLKNNNYSIIGLEDEEIQILGLEIIYYYYIHSYSDLFEAYDMYSPKSIDEFCLDMKNKNKLSNKIQADIFEIKVNYLPKIYEYFKYRNISPKNNNAIHLLEKEIINKFKDKNIRKIIDEIIFNRRNKIATNKMITSMNKNNVNIGIIVFGAFHTIDLMKEIKKQTKNQINIFIAK